MPLVEPTVRILPSPADQSLGLGGKALPAWANPSRIGCFEAITRTPAVDQAKRVARLAGQQQIVRDRHPGQQSEFLKDRPGAFRVRVSRIAEMHLSPID